MVHLTKRFALTALAALALAAVTQPADARSVVAFAGKPQFPADIGCFLEDYGAVRNLCSGAARSWLIPLTVDNAGTTPTTTVVTAYKPYAGNTVGCGTISVSKDHATIVGSSTQYLSTSGAYADINVPAVSVPLNGSQFAYCFIGEATTVSVVNTSW